ncbi:MAG: L-histidine N(alpha)-methyltransferase [Steroidobacteraceae bacterium]
MSLQASAAVAPSSSPSFAAEARAGLTGNGQKSMPPKYFYDPVGSALFEAITQLPEYGLWRAERRLFETHAAQIATLAPATTVIEFGSGSAAKTALLLRALLRQRRVTYCAIDVSTAALEMTRNELAGLAGLRVRTLESEYLPGLDTAVQARIAPSPALVLLLGSSLGNLDFSASVRFLRHVRAALQPGDHLLLGADLVKPEPHLIAAYDDAQGVTAAFNLNLLARMNRELGTDFALTQFQHRVCFNRATHDVEMYLESLVEQTVRFADFTVTFRAGETIHTESSHKYSLAELDRLEDNCGFRTIMRWVDSEGQFASSLSVFV